jgi:hypothetical protein
MLGHLARQKRREDIRQKDLLGSRKVSPGAFKALRHHGKFNAVGAQDVPQLAQHLFDSYVRAHVARAVVSGEQQLQPLARLPSPPGTEHPACLRDLNDA